ncbi:hypothetical protein [Streptomyces sp. HB2AG]|uniref:hypothetical protein n=1 Tax=Streptomyces sp. HB2AG TaxID=2983400 RepID=UPI0022AA688F|nr:hypothetical protein [Streptomyces sp. HB2AG]MCZ2526067.1 hypothetical protein [Streptomyces sp. HB2AG]
MERGLHMTGVRITTGRLWRRLLTRAGQVLLRNGRLVLLTSRGVEIDGAPVHRVRVRESLRAGRRCVRFALNGSRYVVDLGRGPGPSAAPGPRGGSPALSVADLVAAVRTAGAAVR